MRKPPHSKGSWLLFLLAVALVFGFALPSRAGSPFCHITGIVKDFNDGSLTVVVEWGGFIIDSMEGQDATIQGAWWGTPFTTSSSGQVNVVIPNGQWGPGDWIVVQGYLDGNPNVGCCDGASVPLTYESTSYSPWLFFEWIPQPIVP